MITEHGEKFVRRALGYITASITGLSKSELEDNLSCDDIVLADEVFKYHLPPIRRLPPLLWTRLRNDLGQWFITKKREKPNAEHECLQWNLSQKIYNTKSKLVIKDSFKD